MNFHKIISNIERINSIESAVSARKSLEVSLGSLPDSPDRSIGEKIASGHALEVLWDFIAPNLWIFGFVTLAIFVLSNVMFWRLANVLSPPKPPTRPPPSKDNPTHLLVVLGSGGHTAEMLTMLRGLPDLATQYTRRTYVVSSGDSFSALKAAELETEIVNGGTNYEIVTVRRARRVHQTILTTPYSALLCLYDCFKVLRGSHHDQYLKKGIEATPYPGLILTNGPGTGVCMVFATATLLFLGCGTGQMRTIYVESWARVYSLSLSGRILKPLVNRFVVQWDELAKREGRQRAEFVGVLVA